MSKQEFIDNDSAYLEWVSANPNGFVVNCNRNPVPTYLILHRSSCNHISSDARSNWTTTDYIKICSNDLAELAAWAAETVGGQLSECQSCMK